MTEFLFGLKRSYKCVAAGKKWTNESEYISVAYRFIQNHNHNTSGIAFRVIKSDIDYLFQSTDYKAHIM